MPRVPIEEAGDEIDPVCGHQRDQDNSTRRRDKLFQKRSNAVLEIEAEVFWSQCLCDEVE